MRSPRNCDGPGYTESRSNPTGSYNVKPDEIEIFPGPEAYAREDAGVIHFADGRIVRIVSLSDNTPRTEFNLEPRLITNLYDRNREKRRYVKYAEIPAVLREAVISAEDRRFFQHSGFDPIGIVRAVWGGTSKKDVAHKALPPLASNWPAACG